MRNGLEYEYKFFDDSFFAKNCILKKMSYLCIQNQK